MPNPNSGTYRNPKDTEIELLRKEVRTRDKEILDLYKKEAEKADQADQFAACMASGVKYNPITDTFTISAQNYKKSYKEFYKIFKK